jgi:branched-chain amino acid transport system permease protein
MGAAFIWTFPLVLKEIGKVFEINPTVMENVSLVAIGVMIVFILIKEPHGLARLWQLGKQKLRIWPFPH